MLEFAFMQRALVAGALVGLLCAATSFFVVLRRMSFIGVGLSHAAFGGVALAVLLGKASQPLPIAALFTVVVAWSIGWVSRHGRLHADAAIGIMFSCAMAVGVLLLGFARGYQVDVFGLLFGNILAVSVADLWLMAAVAVVNLALLLLWFKELFFLSYDDELARASGLPATLYDYGLLTLLALTIVIATRVVGIILVESLLVIPAATGLQFSADFRRVLLVAAVSSVGATLLGLALSFRFDVASGATIVLVAAAGLGAAGLASSLKRVRVG
jgi:zinc transport system permease protein